MVLKKIRKVGELAENMRDELDVQVECIEDLESSVGNARVTVVSVTERIKRLAAASGVCCHAAVVGGLLAVFVVVCAVTILIGGV